MRHGEELKTRTERYSSIHGKLFCMRRVLMMKMGSIRTVPCKGPERSVNIFATSMSALHSFQNVAPYTLAHSLSETLSISTSPYRGVIAAD